MAVAEIAFGMVFLGIAVAAMDTQRPGRVFKGGFRVRTSPSCLDGAALADARGIIAFATYAMTPLQQQEFAPRLPVV